MEEYPNNPHNIALGLLNEFKAGNLTPDEFTEKMGLFENQLQLWYEQLEQLQAPDEAEAENELLDGSKESVEMFYQAIEMLKEYAQSRDEALAEEAMGMSREAAEIMAELIHITDENLAEIENEGSDPLGNSIVG